MKNAKTFHYHSSGHLRATHSVNCPGQGLSISEAVLGSNGVVMNGLRELF